MSTDLHRQLARFAEALDREAPTISVDDIVGRGPIAVDTDLLERPESDRAFDVNGVPWTGTTTSHDESGDPDVLIDLVPEVAARRSRRRIALQVALGTAAAAVVVVAITAMQRGGNESDPADRFPNPRAIFVSPRNGYSVSYVDRGEATVTPATQLWSFDVDAGFDVIETGSAAVFTGTSAEFPGDGPCLNASYEPAPCGSMDERIDAWLAEYVPPDDRCGVPRSQQAAITIDGESGRVAACPNHIEATVVAGGRLYRFALAHDRSDASAVFDALVATIELTPETAVDFPGLTQTFVSPTYGYSFGYVRGLTPATERWDPSNQPLDDIDFDPRFDAVETGLGAYLEGASTPIPDGVPVDAWVDEYVTPRVAGGCGVPRSQQAAIIIDGHPGRIAVCDHTEATVVAGGRLYLFLLSRDGDDARAMFDAWMATVDLTPETATAP